MVAEQCVVGEPVVVRTFVAARWYSWALVVTSSGIVDTGILATYFETGCHDRGRDCDESPAAVAGATTTAVGSGSTASKRSSEREGVSE